MNNELRVARFVHSALFVGCAVLIALALSSATAQHYVTARHWLSVLNAIDLDKWAGMIENRQSTMLDGPFTFLVSPAIKEEAEKAQVPVAERLYVRRQVAMHVRPSASDVSNATIEALLTSVFRDVKAPELFYPDERALRARLRPGG